MKKYISTAVNYSSLFTFNLCCIIMPHPWGPTAFSLFWISDYSPDKSNQKSWVLRGRKIQTLNHICATCVVEHWWMQIISLLTRRNTEIFPSALYMISLNQSLNLPYCDEFLLTYKKLIKLLVIAGEKIGHSYPFRGPLLWICWLEGQSRVIPKCVYNIKKVISPGNHLIQL